jgi:hypothetical protein
LIDFFHYSNLKLRKQGRGRQARVWQRSDLIVDNIKVAELLNKPG